MKPTKLTPLEVLQRHKARLRLQSDALAEALENDLNYIQRNLGTIIGNTVREAVVSRTPPLVRSLLDKGQNPESGISKYSALIEGIMDILPFFIKGSKGWLAHVVVDVMKKWVFGRK
jgi:hypothetical protein